MKTSKKLKKLSNKGFRGYSIATVAYYGPDDKHATKVAVGIIPYEHAQPSVLERWFNEVIDVRVDKTINEQITSFIKENRAKSVVIADRIFGCPHEEGVDYPDGSTCPQCPFWAIRHLYTINTKPMFNPAAFASQAKRAVKQYKTIGHRTYELEHLVGATLQRKGNRKAGLK